MALHHTLDHIITNNFSLDSYIEVQAALGKTHVLYSSTIRQDFSPTLRLFFHIFNFDILGKSFQI